MKYLWFCVILLAATGCYATPTPTPYALQQYPATWTPAPTPTDTPPAPTATLVIQRTPGALATRDPNARLVPNAPLGTLGFWIKLDASQAPPSNETLARAQILVSRAPAPAARSSAQFLFLETAVAPERAALTSEWNGVVLSLTSTVTAAEIAALRETARPRLVLASAWLTDTARLDQLAPVADGLALQNFLRAADAPLEQFPTESEWLQNVDALSKLAGPETVILNAFDFGASNAASALAQQWLHFALASHLLAANNAHTFLSVGGALPPNLLARELALQLDAPVSGVVKQNGVYQRRFIKGLVLVNPTADTHAFFLPRPYRNRTGSVITQIEMPPHTGEILELAE